MAFIGKRLVPDKLCEELVTQFKECDLNYVKQNSEIFDMALKTIGETFGITVDASSIEIHTSKGDVEMSRFCDASSLKDGLLLCVMLFSFSDVTSKGDPPIERAHAGDVLHARQSYVIDSQMTLANPMGYTYMTMRGVKRS